MKFIITEKRQVTATYWKTTYVCARPGYYRRMTDGAQIPDGSTGGPEWSDKREHALEFKSRRAAMRVKNLCPSAKVETIS